jgi:hypothetical protein
MSLEDKKSQLEKALIDLTKIDSSRGDTLSSINKLKSEILEEQLGEVTPQVVLHSNQELFSCQVNKNKLRKFLQDYPVVRIDLTYIKTGTYCMQVAFDSQKSFQEQYKQIQNFIPYLMEVPEILTLPLKFSGQHIKIKEYTIGEDGIYELIKPEFKEQIWLCRTKGYVSSIVKKFPSWEEALYYVYQNHPYFK